MSIIVFDTENTSLLAAEIGGQENQPHMIELAAIKFDDKYYYEDQLHIIMRPRISIPEETTKINGYTNENVADKKPFIAHWKDIANFWRGSRVIVGHNVMYDKTVLYWELFRIGKHLNFPWASFDICTADSTQKWLGHRLSLSDLYFRLFNENFSDAHKAVSDAKATSLVFKKMVDDDIIQIP